MKDEFSIRNKLIKNLEQKNSIDQDLRNSIWNVINLLFLDTSEYYSDFKNYRNFSLYRAIWISFFRYKINEMPTSIYSYIESLDNSFQSLAWNEVFGLTEFIAKYLNNNKNNLAEIYCEYINAVLERENSIYRLINNFVIPIEEKHEKDEIENALSNLANINSVKIHIVTALRLLSQKEKPDYRNSIKESITAVEGLCSIISRDKSSSLGKALDKIENKIVINPALKIAFDKLYGYRSSSDGIRHNATANSQELYSEDARYWLISCSAFINYLIQKCERHNIKLQ